MRTSTTRTPSDIGLSSSECKDPFHPADHNHHHHHRVYKPPPPHRRSSSSTTPDPRDSCYSIESLSSTRCSSEYSSSSLPRLRLPWRCTFVVLATALACALLVLYTNNSRNGVPDEQNDANSSSHVNSVGSPPVVQFDYTTNEDGGQVTDRPPPPQQISEYVRLYKLPPPLDNDDYFSSSSEDGGGRKQLHHHRFNKHESTSSRHHYYNTGAFRNPSSRLWDPHPQYIFHAFNRRFHLVLNQISRKHSFMLPGFKVTTHRGSNGETWVSRDKSVAGERGGNTQVESLNGCFYNGYVLGDIDSSVAVSLCSGMTGHIRTSTGSYFIEPRSGSEEHEIYQIARQQPNNDHHEHESIPKRSSNTTNNLRITPYDYYSDEDYDSDEELEEEQSSNKHQHNRNKRSLSTERYVELTVVTDQTMSRYHGDNLKHYVLTLLSIVALVYRDASIGNPVNIVLVNFHVLTDTDFSGTQPQQQNGTGSSTTSSPTLHGTSASEMLRNFCKWQKEHNHPDDRHALHHDTALLLTRETICRNPWVGKCDTLGLAELGTMCDHYASCAIVQDNGLSAAFTIAHELGHVLNMPHDDDYKCQSFADRRIVGDMDFDIDSSTPISGLASDRARSSNNAGVAENNSTGPKPVQHFVMSRMLDHNTYPWAWSRCSRHFLTEFLDAGHGYCLEDKPDANLLYNDDENSVDDDNLSSPNSIQQPGEIFSEHKQCELVFGPNSQLCSYMPPCRRLWCTNHGGPESEESEGCRTQHMPWADGTRCGANKWCQRGQCVLKDLEKLRIINGGWGSWQDYGECSRSCGGGVKKSFRECDNPKPKNGGKYCVGPRVRYESCNTFDCANSTGGHDFRASQCATFDGDNFNIHGLPEDVVWVPKYNGISPKDRCKLFCRVQGSSSYYLLKEKVIDGTTCGIDTFDVCVNGACLPAGCDRRLHSSKTLDICGICGGDGSTCTTSQGSYNSTRYGYNTVFRIPSGASNIDIRQRSYDNTARDDNYLALFDPATSEYSLNGHFVVSMFRKTLHYGGSVLEYSGSDQIVERINSSSRPIKRDLEVRVLSVGKLKPPDIVFQYVISSENRTTTTTGAVVDQQDLEGSSSHSDVHVEYSWRGNSARETRSQCSSVCQGTSVAPQSYDCVRRSSTAPPTVVLPSFCSAVEKPVHNPHPCNTHCTIKYSASCPDSCVHARTNYTVECVRVLHSTNTTQKISDSYCVKSGVARPVAPDCVSECRNRRPKWRHTQWSDCSANTAPASVRCGPSGQRNSSAGVQIRNVWCQRFNWRSLIESGVDNYEVVDDAECDGEKPASRRACRNAASGSAAVCGDWKIDEWSPCSTTCGPGRSRALYACVLLTSSQSQILPLDYCGHNPKPVVERPCEMIPCASYSQSNWSECNCAEQTQSRQITCVVNNAPHPDHTICNRLSIPPPETSRRCPDDSECNEYSVKEWTDDCRLYNGKYYRYREVSCDHAAGCAGPAPHSMLECGEWRVESNWSGCNGSCSVGVEVRDVGCYIGGSKVEERRCDGAVGGKPLAERNCYHRCTSGARSLRMGGRGEEGYGGGVSVPTRESNPYYYYNIHGRSGAAEGGPVAYKWVAGAWGKCARMTPRSSSPSGCPSSDTPVTQSTFRKHRQVKCVSESSQPQRRMSTVPSGYCSSTTPMPPESGNCTVVELGTVTPCPVWVTSEWTSCGIPPNSDENCGENTTILHGTKTRPVACVQDTTNSTLTMEHCASSQTPESVEKCVVKASGSVYAKSCSGVGFRWKIGNWSQCIVEGKRKCGGKGRKVRDVACVRVWKGAETGVDDAFCAKRKRGARNKRGNSRPRNVRECARACKEAVKAAFKWVTYDWSNCSRPCGGYGLSSRRVSCHRTNAFEWTDPEPLPPMVVSQNTTNYCSPPKPKENDYCIVSETCDNDSDLNSSGQANSSTVQYSWSTSEWSECTCNSTATIRVSSISVQKRRVFCVAGRSEKTPARYCAGHKKPPRKQKCGCNLFASCAEVRDALVAKLIEVKDGEYPLHVAGKAGVSVYCHGMTDMGSEPKEYVSVVEDNNFSEIYEKRLIRPETCPRNGTRMASCECVNDRNRRVGVTRWRKIKLNVTSLRVDVDDYTFAYSTQDLIGYGTAGDCYSSSMQCPQGRFAIDLRGTGFALSSLTSWTTTGHRATMRVVRKNFGPFGVAGNQVTVSQFIQGKCGGYCGTCAVSKGIGMRLDVV